MTYTEIQKKRKRNYYYLAHSLKIDSRVKKIRVFLGVNLTDAQLKHEISRKKAILDDKISVMKIAAKDEFKLNIDFSQKLFSKSMVEKIRKIKANHKKMINLTDKDVLKNIRESFLIKYTYDTNAAEGNTISLKETELILKKGIVPKSHSLREVYEIENTVNSYEFIETYEGELTSDFILRLHKLVTQNTLANSKNEGKYRLKGQDVAMHGSKHFPPKGGRQIKQLVNEIIDKYKKCKLTKVEAAILFHAEFIAIHPFIDGNGRVSRLIFNWMLMKEKLAPINFPSVEHIEYTDLMEASRDGDSIPLAKHIFEKIVECEIRVSRI